MMHVEMKCENHPEKRWFCKAIAVNRNGRYNGCRNIFPQEWPECPCPGSDLIAVDIDLVNRWHDEREATAR